jgi:hypothetical protein
LVLGTSPELEVGLGKRTLTGASQLLAERWSFEAGGDVPDIRTNPRIEGRELRPEPGLANETRPPIVARRDSPLGGLRHVGSLGSNHAPQ